MRNRKLVYRILFFAFLLFGVVPYILSLQMTRTSSEPRRCLTPLQCWDMAYEDFTVRTRDRVRISGWFVSAGKTARANMILIHGFGSNRGQMTDAVPFLIKNGCNAVLFDLRGHGKSGKALCTLGDHEQMDVAAVARYVRGQNSLPALLWGTSLGGTLAVLSARESGARAVISESAFTTLNSVVTRHAGMYYGLPRFPMVPLTLLMYRLRTGASPGRINVLREVSAPGFPPLLLVGCGEDRRVPPARTREIFDAAAGEKDILIVPGARHGEPLLFKRKAYHQALVEFLNRWIPGS